MDRRHSLMGRILRVRRTAPRPRPTGAYLTPLRHALCPKPLSDTVLGSDTGEVRLTRNEAEKWLAAGWHTVC